MTITEALAEIKTINKRLDKKLEFVLQHLVRFSMVKDPLAKEGGAREVVAREMQAMRDLEERIVQLRVGISKTNIATKLDCDGKERTIQEWLAWRREVATLVRGRVARCQSVIVKAHKQAHENKCYVDEHEHEGDDGGFVVNWSQEDIHKEAEGLEKTLGELDGKLSVLNATTQIVD